MNDLELTVWYGHPDSYPQQFRPTGYDISNGCLFMTFKTGLLITKKVIPLHKIYEIQVRYVDVAS